MAIPYPSNPAVGDTFTYGGILYTWTGIAWISTFVRTPGTVGSVAVVAPITNSGTPTAPVVGIDQSALLIGQSQVTNLVSDLAAKASTTDLTNGLALKANLAGGNTFTGNQTFQNDITHNNFYQNFSNMLTSGRMTIGLSTLSSGVQLGVYSTSATNVGAIIRAAASQTANLQEWQNSSSTVLSSITSTGVLNSGSGTYDTYNADSTIRAEFRGTAGTQRPYIELQGVGANDATNENGGAFIRFRTSRSSGYGGEIGAIRRPAGAAHLIFKTGTATVDSITQKLLIDENGNVFVNGFSAATVGLTVRAAASQTADLQQWQNSSSTNLVSITSAGNFNAGQVRSGTTSGLAQITGIAGSASTVGAIIRGAASQTADMFEIQNNSGTDLLSINASGGLVVGTTHLPGASPGLGQIRTSTDTGLNYVDTTANDSAGTGPGYTARRARGTLSAPTQVQANDLLFGIFAQGYNNASGFSGNSAAVRMLANENFTTTGVGSSIVFETASDGTTGRLERMRVTGSGTVSIGTTSSLAQLGVITSSASTIPLLVRGVASQTASFIEVQNSSSTTLFRVNSSGFGVLPLGLIAGGASPIASTTNTMYSTSATNVGLAIRGAATQSANLLELQNSGGTILSRVDAFGQVLGTSALFGPSSSTNSVAITIRPVANQTADLVQYQNSATTVLSGVNGVGQLYTGSTTALTTATGGTIQSIATGANPLVTMASAHGLTTGDLVVLAGTTGGTYNGTFVVASTPASTTFTITSALTVGQAAAGGTVSDPAQASITARSAGTTGLIIRGAASQTANLQEWQNSAGSLVARLEPAGNFIISGIGVTSGDHRVGTSSYFSAALNVLARATTEIGVVVRGQASQTANLQEWQNSAGTVLANVNSAGLLNMTRAIILTQTNAGEVGIRVRGAVSQTGNLLELQDSAAAILSSISSNGSLTAPSLTVSGSGTYTTGSIYADSNWGMIFRARTVSPVNAQYRWANSVDGELMRLDNSGRLIVSNATSGATQGTAQIEARTVNATTIGMIIRGASSQTANLAEWQNSTPTTVASISPAGVVTSTGLTLTSTTSPITLNGSVGTSGQVLTSAGAGATPTWTTVSGGGSFTGGTLTGNLTLAAGTTSLSPLTFQSGTNLTTVTAGANEYDGTVFYQTSNTNPGRALATQDYYYVSSTDWNPDFSASSSAKSLLGAATRGITVAAGTTYEFELYTTIQHDFVTTSGVSASVDIFNTTVTGSPVVSDVMFVDFSSNTTGFTTSATMSSVRSTTAVTVSAAISSGSRYTIVKAKGIIRITGTGTTKIYPGMQTTSASGDNGWTIGTGTTFKMTPIGNGTVTTVGTWA